MSQATVGQVGNNSHKAPAKRNLLAGELPPNWPPLIHPLPTLRRASPLPTVDACGATATSF